MVPNLGRHSSPAVLFLLSANCIWIFFRYGGMVEDFEESLEVADSLQAFHRCISVAGDGNSVVG